MFLWHEFVRTIRQKSKKEIGEKKPIICVILKKKRIKINNNLKFKSTYTHTHKSWYDCKYSLIKQAITNLVDKKAKIKEIFF